MSRDNPEWFPDRDMSSRPYQGDKPRADGTLFAVEKPTLFDLGATDMDPAIDVPGALRVSAAAARRRGQFRQAAKLEAEAKSVEAKRAGAAGKSFSKAIPTKPAPEKLPKTIARISARPTGRGAPHKGGFGIGAYLLFAGAVGGVFWLGSRKKGGK